MKIGKLIKMVFPFLYPHGADLVVEKHIEETPHQTLKESGKEYHDLFGPWPPKSGLGKIQSKVRASWERWNPSDLRCLWQCSVCDEPVFAENLYWTATRNGKVYHKFLCPHCLLNQTDPSILDVETHLKRKVESGKRIKTKLERGRGMRVTVRDAKGKLRAAVLIAHEQAIRTLWNGAVYEIGIAPSNSRDLFVYFYYAPNLSLTSRQRALPQDRWPKGTVGGNWIFKRCRV